MQILQEQKSALPPTPANRVIKPSKNREVIYDQILLGRYDRFQVSQTYCPAHQPDDQAH